MMGRLPEFIDPIRLAKKGKSLTGQMDFGGMDRLLSMLVSTQGVLDINLTLGVDDAGIRFVRGNLRANVTLSCPRCLDPMDYQIESEVMLGIIKVREQAEKLPRCYEPLLVEMDEISLRDIVEDELILAIPTTLMHDYKECQSITNDADIIANSSKKQKQKQKQDAQDKPVRENPFAILADLKQELKKKS